jgi:TatD DNase family protein
MTVDSHCHLADEAFAGDLDHVVDRARAAGVSAALCILSADEPEEIQRASRVAAAWAEIRFGAAIHPHRAGGYGGRVAEAIAVTRAAVEATGAVAVGEIGLDYHYDFSPRAVQQEVFAAQIGVALERRLPVVIHTREATDDTLALIREAGEGRLRGVMHCFSGTIDEAKRALDLGFFISLSGIVTFPKASTLRELAAFVPDDRVLVETDAPYLAPVPHRGKRNEPAWVAETTKVVAGARGVPIEAMGGLVARNFDALFGPARVDTPAKPMV